MAEYKEKIFYIFSREDGSKIDEGVGFWIERNDIILRHKSGALVRYFIEEVKIVGEDAREIKLTSNDR